MKEPTGPSFHNVCDQGVRFPIRRVHAADGRRELLEIAHVRAEPVSLPAGVFDFKLGEIEFGLTAANESDASPGSGETHCKALPDSAPRPRDQRGHMMVGFCSRVFYRCDGLADGAAGTARPAFCGSRGIRRIFNRRSILSRLFPVQRFKLCRRLRVRKEVALHQRATHPDQSLALAFGFDAFCNYPQTQPLCNPDHRVNQPERLLIGFNRLYERLIEFNSVDLQPVQVAQGREASPEIDRAKAEYRRARSSLICSWAGGAQPIRTVSVNSSSISCGDTWCRSRQSITDLAKLL